MVQLVQLVQLVYLVVLVAMPNAGKTALATAICPDMVKAGYKVVYVNADTGGGNAKRYIRLAKQDGYDCLVPDLVTGGSMGDIVSKLKGVADAGVDMSDRVFLFDTLKKMTDVIQKRPLKAL